ncbi:MAG: universal stress protein [Candidatus Korobacteraceae bacterium]
MMQAQPEMPIAFKNILCATDLAPGSSTIIDYAVSTARRYRSKLYVVHVIPSDIYNSVPPETLPQAVKQTHHELRKELNRFSQSQGMNRVSHEMLLEEGDVRQILLQLVQKYTIDLLVMGTRAHRGLDRLLRGSVAEDVFRQASCPVLIIPPHAFDEPGARIRTILYPTDFSPTSLPGAAYAFSLARRYRARLILLHVISDVLVRSQEQLAQLREPIESRLRELALTYDHLRQEPWLQVEFGPTAERIVRAGYVSRADLIVLGISSAETNVSHQAEGITYAVVREAECPVLTVRTSPIKPASPVKES